MINDVEMLNYILQNAEMGCQGIKNVRKGVKNSLAVDSVLCDQLVRYGKIYHVANSMLKSRGAEAKHISPMAKTMTKIAAQRDLKRDSSPSHAAPARLRQGRPKRYASRQKNARHRGRAYQGNESFFVEFRV